MELITRHTKAAGAADAWMRQYGGTDFNGIGAKLRTLGPSPEPDEVTKVVGNDSWVQVRCTECEQEVYAVVQVGQEPDYDSSTAWLCADCIWKAATMFPPASVG
jgi:hypothetical protein